MDDSAHIKIEHEKECKETRNDTTFGISVKISKDIELLAAKREMVQAQQKLEKEKMELQREKIQLLKMSKQSLKLEEEFDFESAEV